MLPAMGVRMTDVAASMAMSMRVFMRFVIDVDSMPMLSRLRMIVGMYMTMMPLLLLIALLPRLLAKDAVDAVVHQAHGDEPPDEAPDEHASYPALFCVAAGELVHRRVVGRWYRRHFYGPSS